MRETVPRALHGERVDRVVSFLTALPRSEASELVDAGAVSIGGQPVRSRSQRVSEGDEVEVILPESTKAAPVEPDARVEFEVVHVDEHVVVVDKPAGLVVHPGAGVRSSTLVHGLLARFPDLASSGSGEAALGEMQRPGIVHRLDKGTSGLLAVARTPVAYRSLVAQLRDRTMERRYTALVNGLVEASAGAVEAPVGRAASDRTRMAVSAGGRYARTSYRVLERLPEPRVTLIECRLETGRTHQIRVHLAAIGHPLVGDTRYGGKAGQADIHRPFLHANKLSLTHPVSGQLLSFSSELPQELDEVLDRLRSAAV